MYSIQVTSKCCNTKYIYFILMIIYTHKMTPVAQHHLISRVQSTSRICNNSSISSYSASVPVTHEFNTLFLELKVWSFFLI